MQQPQAQEPKIQQPSTATKTSKIAPKASIANQQKTITPTHIDLKQAIQNVTLRRRGGAANVDSRVEEASEVSAEATHVTSNTNIPNGASGSLVANETIRPRTILEDHGIILGKVIGVGNYAKVKIAYSEEYGKREAVKIISKVKAPAEYTQKFLPREIEAVKGLHHENLIAFYESIDTSHRVYLIMQLAENGNLLDYVREKKHLSESQSRSLFQQLISAVEYIHSKNVVHRDIKCENLLLDEKYKLKLIDFGFARKDTRTGDNQVILSKTFCGSYAYACPEILKGIAYDPFMSDIWACGVVCYAMVFGRLPFDGSDVHVFLRRINNPLVFPKSPTVSNECKQLIAHILSPIRMRYTIPQIKDDPWFGRS